MKERGNEHTKGQMPKKEAPKIDKEFQKAGKGTHAEIEKSWKKHLCSNSRQRFFSRTSLHTVQHQVWFRLLYGMKKYCVMVLNSNMLFEDGSEVMTCDINGRAHGHLSLLSSFNHATNRHKHSIWKQYSNI